MGNLKKYKSLAFGCKASKSVAMLFLIGTFALMFQLQIFWVYSNKNAKACFLGFKQLVWFSFSKVLISEDQNYWF